MYIYPYGVYNASMERSQATNAAMNATLHCLTGCAIGEITGMIIGTSLGLDKLVTVMISVSLAFLFGYLLSLIPIVQAGVPLKKAATLVLAADTLSIAVMELVDNAVMLAIPGAMDAGLVNPTFWLSMSLALFVAFWAAMPVNRYLLLRGKGHALVHEYHHGDHHTHPVSHDHHSHHNHTGGQ